MNPETQNTNHVTLTVYDIAGRLIETLVDARQEPGVYQLPISRHQLPSSGIYFYRLTTTGLDKSSPYTQTRKLILLH
ncbi:T9SS type A sorting domain-containing protein [candidate division TA06 bacterium]|nr:T9SS type A sorting domain-containing protein [candidate division TA06 bacterium]